MSLNNKLIFLAGSTGQVGSSILQNILSKYPAARIRAAYHIQMKPITKDRRVEYVCGDLRSQKDCKKMVRGCDYAVMAAATTANSSLLSSSPWALVNDNVIMNLRMLESFYLENIKRVIYVGSATVYQDKVGKIKEDELKLNEAPYPAYFGIGWAGRFIEKMCEHWHRKNNGAMIIVRAANVFGPYAKFDSSVSNFIPALIRKAVDKKEPFEVWGNAGVTRDVIYSEDFGEAIVRLLDKSSLKFDYFNIGSGIGVRVDEVVKWALKYAGHIPRKIIYDSNKPTTIPSRILDCSKAKKCINWHPRYSVEEGLKKTIEWWIQNKGWWKR